MKVKRLIHKGWKEWNNTPESFKNKSIFGKKGWAGKYQYIYESDKGQISLVYLAVGGFAGMPLWMWEIYELSANNLFEDVERFRTKKQALERIKELLG